MARAFSNISFIGGIHGVGKSTLCKTICSDLGIKYLSASNVLKWKELSKNPEDKKVEDIGETQDRLVEGLSNTVDNQFHYLLDGHFCLFDKSGEVSRVPLETFEIISPISLHLITGDTNLIKARLEARDNRFYDINLLNHMQEEEISYATELSKQLKVSLSLGDQDNYQTIVNTLSNLPKRF